MTTTDRLRAAPFVTLVLSFAAVLGLGMFIGPTADEPPASPSTAVPEQPPPPSDDLDAPSDPPPVIPVVGPDEDGRVVLGPLEPGRPFAPSTVPLALNAYGDGRLQVCVGPTPGQRVTDADWQPHGTSSGLRKYCTAAVRGETLEFTVGTT